MGAYDIGFDGLALAYLLLIPPLLIIYWQRLHLMGDLLVAVLRMSLQLMLVGIYLQLIFARENNLLTGLWLIIMIGVADLTVLRSCKLHMRSFAFPLALALVCGTLLPLFVFLKLLLRTPQLLPPQYAIPLTGMILGNCLRADIIGIKSFYNSMRASRAQYEQSIAYGASFKEATRPFLVEACRNALTPTIATMSTIGLVSLPGMMTGVILGGTDPMTAIKYQIAIMLAIFCGTAITVFLAIFLSMRTSFDTYGNLKPAVFSS